jgi:hypothetical protein
MKIGSAYHIKEIEPRHWQACAMQLRLPAAVLIERLHDMTKRLDTLAPTIADDLRQQGLSHPIVHTLSDSISQRASKLLSHYFN